MNTRVCFISGVMAIDPPCLLRVWMVSLGSLSHLVEFVGPQLQLAPCLVQPFGLRGRSQTMRRSRNIGLPFMRSVLGSSMIC